MNHTKLAKIKADAKIIIDQKEINLALDKLAKQIENDYQEKTPIFIVVLNGGLIFAGQLLPRIDILCEIDYCHATRYQGEQRGAELVWKSKPQTELSGRDVILVDDILDEGITLKLIEQYCFEQNAKSVKTLVLVEKEHHRKAYPEQRPDYCELVVPDQYVFGFGMDYSHYWRNTLDIRVHQDD
jgi:hypoxanthine phosphoribosyltransferase